MHAGNKAHHPESETQLYSWFEDQQKHGFAASTSGNACKALQINANLKDRCKKGYVGGLTSFYAAIPWFFEALFVSLSLHRQNQSRCVCRLHSQE